MEKIRSAHKECAEKARLTLANLRALTEVTRLTKLLTGLVGVIKKADYRANAQFADDAQKSADYASAALDAHVAMHGC